MRKREAHALAKMIMSHEVDCPFISSYDQDLPLYVSAPTRWERKGDARCIHAAVASSTEWWGCFTSNLTRYKKGGRHSRHPLAQPFLWSRETRFSIHEGENKMAYDHFYSTCHQPPAGYHLERIECFVDDPHQPHPAETVALLHAHHPGNGDHFYTTDTQEYHLATTAWPAGWGYNELSIAPTHMQRSCLRSLHACSLPFALLQQSIGQSVGLTNHPLILCFFERLCQPEQATPAEGIGEPQSRPFPPSFAPSSSEMVSTCDPDHSSCAGCRRRCRLVCPF